MYLGHPPPPPINLMTKWKKKSDGIMGIFKKRNCLVSYPLMICFLQPFPCHILHLSTYFYFVMSIPSRFSVVVIMFKCLYKQTKTNIWYRNIWNKLIEHNEYIYINMQAPKSIMIDSRASMTVNTVESLDFVMAQFS